MRARLGWLPPCLLVAILVTPCLPFTYLWDDYWFLRNALASRWIDFVPNGLDYFYRPISGGIYFALLNTLGTHGALIGHLLNAAFLVFVVYALYRIVEQLANARVAAYAAFAFACTGAAPLLVGWVSGSQDLLAMMFVLTALGQQLKGRRLAAMILTAMALLSKETALALVPAIALSEWLAGRRKQLPWSTLGSYGLLVALWTLLHPGVQSLLHRGLRSGATGYVGLEHPERWAAYLGKYSLTAMNIPLRSIVSPWWPTYVLVFALAATVLMYALIALRRSKDADRTETAIAPIRLAALALMLALPPLLLTSLMVRHWAPYYAVFPALGVSIGFGLFADRLPIRVLLAAFALYLALGFWCRTSRFDIGMPEEPNLRVTSAALEKVQANFLAVRPSLPRGSTALVSVQRGGLAAIYTHVYFLQAMRIWYRDPTLQTMRPDWRPAQGGEEHLFWTGEDLNVHEIDLETMRPRSSGAGVEYAEYQKTVRYYARGLAAAGELERAVGLLLVMPEPDRASWALDRRIAATLLFAGGQERAATDMIAPLPRVRADNAIEIVAALLADTPPHVDLDRAALRGFGLAPDDPESLRGLMRKYVALDRPSEAARFASELLVLRPSDSEAIDVLQRSRLRTPEFYDRPAPPEAAD